MGKYDTPIPANLIPSGDICVPVSIPNDPDYITMFVEHIRRLTLDHPYARDDSKSALIVRQQWMDRTFAPMLDNLTSGYGCAGEFYAGEIDCFAYPNYSPFITYLPINPFNEPNTVPPGYADKPFYVYGLNAPSAPPGYLDGDIIVPFAAINLDPFDLFSGNLVSIKITVTGSGQIELDLLKVIQGGLAVIGINTPPNIVDLIAGIVGAGEQTIDLFLDAVSLPPETEIVTSQEVNITADPGIQTDVYITFFPVIDDSLIPLRFGGGLRKNGIQLCGFEESCADMGVTDIRFTGSVLEYFKDGVWTAVDSVIKDCADVETCLATSPIIVDMTGDINQNTTNINTNYNSIVNNTANISSNDQDIANIWNTLLPLDAYVYGTLAPVVQANYDGVQYNYSLLVTAYSDIDALEIDVDLLKTNDIALASDILDNLNRIRRLENCIDCSWQATFDFALGDFADIFTPSPGGAEYNLAGYYENIVNQQTCRLDTYILSPTWTVTGAKIWYYINSTGSGDKRVGLYPVGFGGAEDTNPNTDSAAAVELVLATERATDTISSVGFAAKQGGANQPAGVARITAIRIDGKGTIPDEFLPFISELVF